MDIKKIIIKKVFQFIFILALILTATSCSEKKPVSSEDNSINSEDNSISSEENTLSPVNYAGQDENGQDIYNIHIGDTTHKGVFLLNSYESSEKSNPLSLEVYGKAWGGDYTPILAITKEKKLLLFELERCDLYPPFLYLGDIDGDSWDEIIILSTIFYRMEPMHVLKLKGNELVELYRFPQYTDDPSLPTHEIRDSIPVEALNFGFTSKSLDNYKVVLEFSDFNFSKTFDILESRYDYINHWFYDENGELDERGLDELEFGYIHDINLIDVDGDQICEIVCKQEVGFGYKQYIGDVIITLKYDDEKGIMNIIDIEFEELED